MKRRGILKALTFLPLFGIAATSIPAEAKTEIDEHDPASRKYRDFRYYWTGWKTFPDNTRIVGQWIANKINEDVHIFSSVPGYAGQHNAGAHFNLVTLDGQKRLYIESSFEERELEKWAAHNQLLAEIDKYYDELIDPRKAEFKFEFTGFKKQ